MRFMNGKQQQLMRTFISCSSSSSRLLHIALDHSFSLAFQRHSTSIPLLSVTIVTMLLIQYPTEHHSLQLDAKIKNALGACDHLYVAQVGARVAAAAQVIMWEKMRTSNKPLRCHESMDTSHSIRHLGRQAGRQYIYSPLIPSSSHIIIGF